MNATMNVTMNGASIKIPTRRALPPLTLGESPAMVDVCRLIDRVAPTDASVLISGESGVGKKIVARLIHDRSTRAGGTFVSVDCAAIPAELIEAELFGAQRAGAIERADGGTLFLDEFTALSPQMQARLLRVLESGKFYRVGGINEFTSDIRVIAASNHCPFEAAKRGQLREDLLYRLAVFPISIPPLRNRGADAGLLADRFLQELNQRHGSSKRFAPGAGAKVQAHSWPGNVRELKNCVEHAFILADDMIELEPLMAVEAARLEVRVGTRIDEVERSLIEATLQHYRGNKRRAADTLGCSLKTLYNKLNAYSQSQQSLAGT